ncbi:MAG TPA: serine hydrolase [Elusimicrobiota bacterium]|nr:serine hydrolase [Elusimicrobiota bacterium]
MGSAISSGLFPGGQVVVSVRGGVVLDKAYGTLGTAADGPVTGETLYDLASLTKMFVTTLALRLVSNGRLDLEESIGAYLADFEGSDVRVHHLLTHSGGLTVPLYEHTELFGRDRAEVVRLLRGSARAFKPGSRSFYNDNDHILLGLIIEKITGQPLSQAVETMARGDLGCAAVRYNPAKGASVAGASVWRFGRDEKRVVGEVHDDVAWVMGGVAGHAGLFASARDVCRLAARWRESGRGLFDERLHGRAVSSRFDRDNLGESVGYGWKIGVRRWMSDRASPRAYGHLGYTGTMMVIDPEYDVMAVFLSNRVYAAPRFSGKNALMDVRAAVMDAVLGWAASV